MKQPVCVCLCVRDEWDECGQRKRANVLYVKAYVSVCGDIVFYKLRSKSEAAIEHNITIYLMAKYCKIYHSYIAPGPKTLHSHAHTHTVSKRVRMNECQAKPSQFHTLNPQQLTLMHAFYLRTTQTTEMALYIIVDLFIFKKSMAFPLEVEYTATIMIVVVEVVAQQ